MTNTRHAIVEQPDERGSALIGVLLLLMMMSALAAALGVSGQTETLISRNQRSGAQARAAAEAGLNHAVELATTYIFEWKANGAGSAEEAVDRLLWGPDLASGTVATDADNGSLGTRVEANGVVSITAAEEIPLGKWLLITGGIIVERCVNSTCYEASIMDDAGAALGEDSDLFNDINQTLIIRATGYGPDNSMVTLEALIGPFPLGALVTNGNLNITGSVAISGTEGNVHTNGNLTIGGSAAISGTATATGTYTGTVSGTGGAPELPIPPVRASDYRQYADFILTSSGTMTNLAGTVLVCCNNWSWDSAAGPGPGPAGQWSIGSTAPANGTYYVQGSVRITGSPGSAMTPVLLTLIAEGSIDISGSPDIAADTPELLFVTDGDLEISGGLDALDPLTVGGQMLVHEQLKLSGNPSLAGQLIVENAPSVSTLVTANAVSGNVTITYNGGLGGGVYSVTGWQEIRE